MKRGQKWTEGDPFTGVQSSHYWSSTTLADYSDYAWMVSLNSGFVSYDRKTEDDGYVWPVRGRR